MTTTATAPLHLEPPVAPERALGKMATTLVGSEILRIAGEVRALQAQGKPVLNLTVGDFAPKQFRIPAELEAAIARALVAGETNYPPSDGVAELRRAVRGFYQRELGLDIPADAIAAYERVKDQIDLDSIRARERVTRHDVKARIDEFCALAGHEHVHKGMTSRDATENVEQTLILRSLQLVREHYGACLYRLAERVRQYRTLALTARTHNVPAQMTTVGKRLATFGTEGRCGFTNAQCSA